MYVSSSCIACSLSCISRLVYLARTIADPMMHAKNPLYFFTFRNKDDSNCGDPPNRLLEARAQAGRRFGSLYFYG